VPASTSNKSCNAAKKLELRMEGLLQWPEGGNGDRKEIEW